MRRRVLFPLPTLAFDVTECAVPFTLLTRAGVECVFATEGGVVADCDRSLLTGVLFSNDALAAEPTARAFYADMIKQPCFQQPLSWSAADFDPSAFDALFLVGGHAPPMRQYLESASLQTIVKFFFDTNKPVAAICHGVLVAARAGCLKGRRTTCLPKYMERNAFLLTWFKLGRHYRTYDAYLQDEVASLGAIVDAGPWTLIGKGTETDDSAAFVVEDNNYLSARWPGDAFLIAKKLLTKL
jgi:putative intracellular protease/amidase